eukprot:scaffold34560_cov148-Skeletonema_marinoi.AAC.4
MHEPTYDEPTLCRISRLAVPRSQALHMKMTAHTIDSEDFSYLPSLPGSSRTTKNPSAGFLWH